MYRFKTPAALLAVAVLAMACSETTTAPTPFAPDGPVLSSHATEIVWTGNGSDNLPCTGGYHWILAGHGGGTGVPQFFSSETPAGADMHRPSGNNDPATNAAWHYNSGLVDLQQGVTPHVVYPGADLSRAVLTISNCLEDPFTPEGDVTVEKDADTRFKRTHEWDIAKRVETQEGHVVGEDDTPKIWLYTDGSGDETATWYVDVTYLGYEDTNGQVFGNITITNTGNLPARIDNVVDELDIPGVNVTVTCDEDLPYVLELLEVLECTYESDKFDPEDGTNTVRVTGEFLDLEYEETGDLIDETDTADFEFDEPTKEKFACVTIEDTNAGFALKYDGGSGVELCAEDYDEGEGEEFSYDQDFAWEDYGQEGCGSDRIDNTASIVETEQDADATLKINIQCFEFDSAWAMGSGTGVTAHAFCDNGFNNWGWSNAIARDYGPQDWTLYAGAGQCDTSKGWEAGIFRVSHTLLGGFVYQFIPAAGVIFEGAAVFADSKMFPTLNNGRNTTAPGQYYIANPLADAIYVIAHVNAGQPDPDFGPE